MDLSALAPTLYVAFVLVFLAILIVFGLLGASIVIVLRRAGTSVVSRRASPQPDYGEPRFNSGVAWQQWLEEDEPQ